MPDAKSVPIQPSHNKDVKPYLAVLQERFIRATNDELFRPSAINRRLIAAICDEIKRELSVNRGGE